MLTAQSYRYHLPKKAIKADCPQCGPKHRRTLSRYVDATTGQPLPESFGRCDREANCAYHVSPYRKDPSGNRYADEVFSQQPKDEWAVRSQRTNRPRSPLVVEPVYSIPDEVFSLSIGHYKNNEFARLLGQHFGQPKADTLLHRFQIGTSARWPGATVFWYTDEQGRKRGGQIKLFGSDWHTAKKPNGKSKVDWVHTALRYRLERDDKPLPDWLQMYIEKGERSPCLFGLPQLLTAPADMPVAVVESPKTAVICSGYVPGFVWLAVGALSYLNAERMAPLRGRRVVLYPDLNAFQDWSKRADQLCAEGFTVDVSNYLETIASDEQKQAGLDLADYLLQQSEDSSTVSDGDPASVLRGTAYDVARMQRIFWSDWTAPPRVWNKTRAHKFLQWAILPTGKTLFQPANKLPDLPVIKIGDSPTFEPNPPGAKPCISAMSSHQWSNNTSILLTTEYSVDTETTLSVQTSP